MAFESKVVLNSGYSHCLAPACDHWSFILTSRVPGIYSRKCTPCGPRFCFSQIQFYPVLIICFSVSSLLTAKSLDYYTSLNFLVNLTY